jgi:hypothetical protein
MTVDWTINFGHILTAIGLLGGAVGIVYAVKADVKVIKFEIDSIKDDLKAMAGVLIEIGKQNQRLNDHERRIMRLEDEA